MSDKEWTQTGRDDLVVIMNKIRRIEQDILSYKDLKNNTWRAVNLDLRKPLSRNLSMKIGRMADALVANELNSMIDKSTKDKSLLIKQLEMLFKKSWDELSVAYKVTRNEQ